MSGTKDVPGEWQGGLAETLTELGFRPAVSTLCLYYHSSLGLRVVEHVDDLLCVGPGCCLVSLLATRAVQLGSDSYVSGSRAWVREVLGVGGSAGRAAC